MSITRRRFLLGGSLPTEGVRGTITLTESQNSIVLDNPFGTTNLMVMLRQIDGINENAWASHGMFYFPYAGNNGISTDVHYMTGSLESREGWNYSTMNSRVGLLSVTATQITIHAPSSQFPYLAGTYEYIIVKL